MWPLKIKNRIFCVQSTSFFVFLFRHWQVSHARAVYTKIGLVFVPFTYSIWAGPAGTHEHSTLLFDISLRLMRSLSSSRHSRLGRGGGREYVCLVPDDMKTLSYYYYAEVSARHDKKIPFSFHVSSFRHLFVLYN